MSHVTYEWVVSDMNESCPIWMSHVTYEWVMSYMNESCHIWMSHVTYEWVMHVTHEWSMTIWMSTATHCNNTATHNRHTRLIHMFMPHSYVAWEWVMSHVNTSCPIWISHVTHEWRINIWISLACRNSFMCVTWLIHACDMTCSYGAWRIHMWHDWFLRNIWMKHEHMNESCVLIMCCSVVAVCCSVL